MHEPLTKDTFLLYCSTNYDGRHCATMDDFDDDLNRIKYIKKLITRYLNEGELKERLILNHIIILNNVFGAHAASRILYFKLSDQFNIIKPFLVQIGILPTHYYNIGEEGNIIDTDLISMDANVVNTLRDI